MSIRTVAILSPGDMGHAVGRVLKENGLRVITCLNGRSARTKELAHRANIEDVPSLEDLLDQSDLILSVIVPSEATKLAQQVAKVLQARRINSYYADCNAISPQTARKIDTIISSAGGRFINASIIGSPPGKGEPPRFYVSGAHAKIMSELNGKGIQVRFIGDEIGRASAIKMCYAALTKGSQALWIALLTAAESMGLTNELRQEFLESQPIVYKQMEKQVPGVPVKARRWLGEMEEIASTFAHVGLTPQFHKGASEIFRFVGQTSLAEETPENRDRTRTLEQTISVFARNLKKK
jgi:3-hydroxyisobutyrate dehydrogenase-like beta-hydroxyacid dehydrogenase